jgi:hypothetical protein
LLKYIGRTSQKIQTDFEIDGEIVKRKIHFKDGKFDSTYIEFHKPIEVKISSALGY